MALPLSYNWKNLLVRKTTSTLTVLVIAAVVAVFCWLTGLFFALDHALSRASDDHKLIVLKAGATSETNSAIQMEEFHQLTRLSGIALEPMTSGTPEPLKSPEMIVQVWLKRLSDGGQTNANVAVRGVSEAAFHVHRNVKLEGRCFQQGKLEVIVGRAAAKQFAGLEIGKTVNLGYSGQRGYEVVGFFTAEGGPLESEIWGPLTTLMDSYNRTVYSSVSIRLTDDADPEAAVQQIEGPEIGLTAKTEPQYWSEQAGNVRTYLKIVLALVSIMALAAVFAIANTMFAATAGRVREFAMLRTIGFSGGQVLLCVIIEAVIIGLVGAGIGCLACAGWLALYGRTKDMFGQSTFTTLAFEIHLTPATAAAAVILVCILSICGSIVPALRAGNVSAVSALRQP